MNLIVTYCKRVYHSPRHLLLHVLFILGILYMQIESNHETNTFKNIIRVCRADAKNLSDTALLQDLMVLINKMMRDRNDIFQNTEQLSFKSRLFQSVDADLMYGAGACGGFSKVFARAVKVAGYKTRIGQMKVNGSYGGHILLEVYLPSLKKWVVMDPLYMLYFMNPQGVWAGFEEVQHHWDYYKQQVTLDYKEEYKYEGIRYTNWEKVPVLGPLAYQTLVLVRGRTLADEFSLRPYILDHYRMNKWILMILFIAYIAFDFVYLNRKYQS